MSKCSVLKRSLTGKALLFPVFTNSTIVHLFPAGAFNFSIILNTIKLIYFISGKIKYVKASEGCSAFYMLNKPEWYLFISEETKCVREDVAL